MQQPEIATQPTREEPVETLCLPGGRMVAASQRRFWLLDAGWQARPGQNTLLPHGTADGMKQLLAACLLAGSRSHGPAAQPAAPRGRQTLAGYLWQLAGMYCTTHATPGAMLLAAQQFDRCGHAALAGRCREVAAEEAGHDRLALADLQALGLDAARFVDAVRPPMPAALAGLMNQLVQADWPVAVFGYAFALERTALFVDTRAIARVEACLPPGVRATRCLRVHSAAGTDAHHVSESLEFMAGLAPADRAAIALATFETTRVMRQPVQWPGEDAVLQIARQCAVADAPWLQAPRSVPVNGNPIPA